MPRHRADRDVRPYGFFRCHREVRTGGRIATTSLRTGLAMTA